MRGRAFSGKAIVWGVVWLVLVLGVLATSPSARADEPQTLPPAVSVPLHSADDVFSRERSSPATPRRGAPVVVKPYRVPDPEALRQWRELLRDHPDALPPAPGFVEDGPPQPRP